MKCLLVIQAKSIQIIKMLQVLSGRVRKNYLGETQPQGFDIKIKHLIRDIDTFHFRPVYQRHIKWSPKAMNSFIGTIVDNSVVPEVLLYKLHPEDKNEKNRDKESEVMDGQHRLYTIDAFVSATYQTLPFKKNQFIVHWEYETQDSEGRKKITPVFYKLTPDVDEYCRKKKFGTPCILDDLERSDFDNYTIHIKTIQKCLTLNERRKIFLSLQNGVKVRNTDLLKNMTDCKLIAFIEQNEHLNLMIDVVLEHSTKRAYQYSIPWIARMFLEFMHSKLNPSKPVSEVFLVGDKIIQNRITINHECFNPTDDHLYEFDDNLREFVEFIQSLNGLIMLNPTHIFVLFYFICIKKIDHGLLRTHMSFWTDDGNIKDELWDNNADPPTRRIYFNEKLEELMSITGRASEIDDTPISHALRKQVWDKCRNGLCTICCTTEITNKTFHAGHIIARARGGPTEIGNLLPMCEDCNRRMGTMNALKFQRDVYPEAVQLIDLIN